MFRMCQATGFQYRNDNAEPIWTCDGTVDFMWSEEFLIRKCDDEAKSVDFLKEKVQAESLGARSRCLLVSSATGPLLSPMQG